MLQDSSMSLSLIQAAFEATKQSHPSCPSLRQTSLERIHKHPHPSGNSCDTGHCPSSLIAGDTGAGRTCHHCVMNLDSPACCFSCGWRLPMTGSAIGPLRSTRLDWRRRLHSLFEASLLLLAVPSLPPQHAKALSQMPYHEGSGQCSPIENKDTESLASASGRC
jgi:hypothetical protein